MTKITCHKNDDLWEALERYPPALFRIEDVKDIAAEVPGEADFDGVEWWWILELSTGGFFLISGWCDYSGWWYQSETKEVGVFPTAMKAAEASPEESKGRRIRANLVGQLTGKYPKFTYWE